VKASKEAISGKAYIRSRCGPTLPWHRERASSDLQVPSHTSPVFRHASTTLMYIHVRYRKADVDSWYAGHTIAHRERQERWLDRWYLHGESIVLDQLDHCDQPIDRWPFRALPQSRHP